MLKQLARQLHRQDILMTSLHRTNKAVERLNMIQSTQSQVRRHTHTQPTNKWTNLPSKTINQTTNQQKDSQIKKLKQEHNFSESRQANKTIIRSQQNNPYL